MAAATVEEAMEGTEAAALEEEITEPQTENLPLAAETDTAEEEVEAMEEEEAAMVVEALEAVEAVTVAEEVETMVEAMEEEEATMEATAVEEEEDGGDLSTSLSVTPFIFFGCSESQHCLHSEHLFS